MISFRIWFPHEFIDCLQDRDRIFISAHKISAVAGVEFIDTSHPYLQATGNGFSNDFIREISYANQDTRKGTSNISHSRSMSYLANFNYTYDNRYTLTLTGRRQGNSAFSEYSQWQAYGAAALRWNLHREKFFQVPWISQLSLRVSYGANGNSRVDSSSSYGSYSLSGTYGANMAATLSSPANPGLSWEKTYIFNPGINLGLWKGRIGLDIDYYNRSTHDVIYDGRVSSVITSGGVKHNVGIIENQGWEFVLNTTNIVCLYLPKDYKSGHFTLTDAEGNTVNHEMKVITAPANTLAGRLFWLSFENSPDGIHVQIKKN